MSFNKYFFYLKSPEKQGQVLGNFNNSLNFKNNLIVLENSSLVLTSSNDFLKVTGNLFLKNETTSSYLTSNTVSFSSDNSTKITKSGNEVNFDGTLEFTGSVEAKNKIVSQEITGSITEVAPGKPFILGRGGINARKRLSNGKHYIEIFKGDSNVNGNYSPASAAITVNIVGDTATFASPSTPNLNSNVISSSGKNHTLKLHEYWATDFSKYESVYVFCNLVAANEGNTLSVDFRWTGAGGLGNQNDFFIGNKVKIYYLFSSDRSNCKVFLDFENQTSASKITHTIQGLDSLSNDQKLIIANDKTRLIRSAIFTTNSEDFVFSGKLPDVSKVNYVSGGKTKQTLEASFSHNRHSWDLI